MLSYFERSPSFLPDSPKTRRWLTFLLAFLSFPILSDSTLGQISPSQIPVPDRTLPQNTTVTNLQPNQFLINGGTTAGNNLFHSFQSFSVPTGTSVQFNNSLQIANIISRVTGNQISQINGTLAANGNANFFLINPNGIQFGKDAQLNLGGALILSTANSLIFSDGLEFSAKPTEALLSVNVPLGLQFNQPPNQLQSAEIKIEGRGWTPLSQDLRFVPSAIVPQVASDFLQVKPNQAIAIVGGNINLDGGVLYAPGGKLELAAVKQGTVSFDRDWNFDYRNASQLGEINLISQSLIDVSGIGNSKINIQGSNVNIKDGSIVLSQNQGDTSVSGIQISAKESIVIVGRSTVGGFSYSSVLTDGIGSAPSGDISISAKNLQLVDGSSIVTRGFNLAVGGNVNVVVDNLEIRGAALGSPIAISTLGTLGLGLAKGGDVTVNTGSLAIAGGANINASSFGFGDGGNVKIVARDTIVIEGINEALPSAISSSSFNRGNGGNLDINTPKLSVLGGGRVSAGTGAFGNAGKLEINASEAIEVRGNVSNSRNPSSIDSSASVDLAIQTALGLPSTPSGNAGSVKLVTPKLIISDGGSVSVRNDGTGNPGQLQIFTDATILEKKANISAASNFGTGGNIKIDTQTLSLDNSGIVSSILVNGTGSDIEINAAKSVAIAGNGLDNLIATLIPLVLGTSASPTSSVQFNAGILTGTFGLGNSGNLSINTPNLTVTNGSFITTATLAQGNAGNLALKVKDTIWIDDSLISTNSAASGKAGNLNVEVGKIFGLGAGGFTSGTVSSGSAGNISVIAAELVDFSGAKLDLPFVPGVDLSLRAGLSATAALSTGASGSLFVNVPHIRLADRASISTTSFTFAEGGNIKINADSIDISGDARINGQGLLGSGGNVDIQVSGSILLRNGSISAASGSESFGGGDGGNIKINSPLILLLDGSRIDANAFLGEGGNINITAQGLLSDRASQISASSRLGLDGIVQLNSPDLDPASGLVKLTDQVTDPSRLISLSCSAKPGSSFVVVGRGGLPPNAAERFRLSALEPNSENLVAFKKPLTEATSWQKTTDGKVTLTAALPGRSNFNPNCENSIR
jgi:filamentous hemagglutinin family protein